MPTAVSTGADVNQPYVGPCDAVTIKPPSSDGVLFTHDDAILSIGMINVDHTPARIRRHGHAAKRRISGHLQRCAKNVCMTLLSLCLALVAFVQSRGRESRRAEAISTVNRAANVVPVLRNKTVALDIARTCAQNRTEREGFS